MLQKQGWIFALALAFSLGEALPGRAQEPNPADQPQSGGWRRFQDPAPGPASLTLPAGTWVTVRVDQLLSSDHNQQGDGFTATLAQPLVAQGRVVAVRGQTLGGRVAVAEKAGRVKGTSRLGLQLIELTLVDGKQVPIRTALADYQAGTSVGRDAAAVATTTGVGAAIGAAANGGFGAGMGAIAGADAGTIGVLATRGKPTIVYPEAQLTFRLEEAVTISTAGAEQAFHAVTQGDYEQRVPQRQMVRTSAPPPSPYGYYNGWGGYWGDPYWSPYFYGPRFYYYGGRGFGRRW